MLINRSPEAICEFLLQFAVCSYWFLKRGESKGYMLMVCNCFQICVLITVGTCSAEVIKVSNTVSPCSFDGIFPQTPRFSLCKDIFCHYISGISLIGNLCTKILPGMLSWNVPSHNPLGQKVPELTSAVKLYNRRHYWKWIFSPINPPFWVRDWKEFREGQQSSYGTEGWVREGVLRGNSSIW